MKTLNVSLIAPLAIALMSLSACGMNPESTTGNRETNGKSLNDSPSPYPVTDSERTKSIEELLVLRRQIIALEGQLIAPAKEDLAAHAELLKNPNAGLARVFPRDSMNEKKPLLVNGGGAYYQFKGRTNEYGHGSDLEYSTEQGPKFSVGFAGVDFGFMAQLGKIDLRDIGESTPAVAFALTYPSPSGLTEPAWRAEQRKWSTGTVENGVGFKDETEAVVGMSYVVRSVSQGTSEIVAVFQVVRRDPIDGSLVLAWKLLKELEKPILKRD